jgi:hypothetical protein
MGIEIPASLLNTADEVIELDAAMLQRMSLEMACAVKRRRFSSGCKSHPANAPAGSNRSSYGGNEVAEAFG